MASEFRLQIVHKGQVAIGWQPGDRLETDLVEELCQRAKAKGLGVFKTEKAVLDAVRSAFREMLLDLKRRV